MMIAKQFHLFLLLLHELDVAYSRLDPQATFASVSHLTHTFPTKYNTLKIRHSKSALFYVQEPIPTGETEVDDGNKNNIESTDETKQPEAESQDKVWMQATRTLGSLFLHQEDAARGHENKTNGYSEPFPFHESTLSSYLLNLKRQEEVNREKKSSEPLKERNTDEKNIMGTPGKKLVAEFHIDQVSVCSSGVSCLKVSSYLMSINFICIQIIDSRKQPKR